MSAPDPEGIGLLAKVLAASVAIVAPIWGARTWLEKRFAAKADKHAVTSQLQDLKNELGIQRQTIGKVFDHVRENEGKSEVRHRELMLYLLEKRK